MDRFEREALFNEHLTQIEDRSEECQDSNGFTKKRYAIHHLMYPCIAIPWFVVAVLFIVNVSLLAKVYNQNGTGFATEALYSKSTLLNGDSRCLSSKEDSRWKLIRMKLRPG